MSIDIPIDALTELEREVDLALVHEREPSFRVLGYGEISTVIAWPSSDGPWACKRLPVFETQQRFDDYATVFHDYLSLIRGRDTLVVESELFAVPRDDGRIAGYCVQPVLPSDTLARNALAAADDESGRAILRCVVQRIAETTTPQIGLDGQLTNWALDGDTVALLDVTTPFLRDAQGRDRLDLDLFLAALPAVLRAVTKKLLVKSILSRYFDVRTTVLDLAANLHLAGLPEWLPALVEVANDELGIGLTEAEARKYYASDARLWAFLQWTRRVDRAWQRRVRRRPYPFLLPGRIERNL